MFPASTQRPSSPPAGERPMLGAPDEGEGSVDDDAHPIRPARAWVARPCLGRPVHADPPPGRRRRTADGLLPAADRRPPAAITSRLGPHRRPRCHGCAARRHRRRHRRLRAHARKRHERDAWRLGRGRLPLDPERERAVRCLGRRRRAALGRGARRLRRRPVRHRLGRHPQQRRLSADEQPRGGRGSIRRNGSGDVQRRDLRRRPHRRHRRHLRPRRRQGGQDRAAGRQAWPLVNPQGR